MLKISSTSFCPISILNKRISSKQFKGRQIIIEIYVTHKINDEKIRKIKELDVSTIEIDLSKTDREITPELLRDILLKDSEKKKWIYNSYENKLYENELAKIEAGRSLIKKMPKIERGFAVHVDYCPVKARVWHGKPYANVIDDCFSCEYFLEHDEDYVYCDYFRQIRKTK